MTDRNEMEKPAMILAVAIGLGLMVVGVAGIFLGGVPLETYNVSWTAEVATSDTAALAMGDEVTIPLVASDLYKARLAFTIDCTDNFNAVTENEAEITWSVVRAEGETLEDLASGTTTCAQMENTEVEVQNATHPDLGDKIDAESLEAAQEELWAAIAAGNETATYTLRVSVDRAPGTIPIGLPAGGASFSGEAFFSYEAWHVTATETPEVIR